MSDQTKKFTELIDKVSVAWEPPATQADQSLLEIGLACVLSRSLTGAQIEKSLKAMTSAFPDWNELRVSQVQEFRDHIKTKSNPVQDEVAREVKDYLQEIFQRNHGFDLEKYREDLTEAAKFFTQVLTLGPGVDHFLLLHAGGGTLPMSTGVVRVLDRTGLMKRTSSLRKAQANLESHVPEDLRVRFGIHLGMVAGTWCDSKKPLCWECPLVKACPFGKKVEKDWQVQQKRLDQQRKREDERRRKEEQRAEKRRAAEEKKRQLVEAKLAAKREREEARRKREEEKRQRVAEMDRARADARKKRDVVMKISAKKAAAQSAADKKAAGKKSAAPKTAVTKQAATKKKTAKKGGKKTKTTAKKTTAKKTTAKKPTKKVAKKAKAKKTGSKKTTKTSSSKASKSVRKAKVAKRPVSKKKATKKPAAKRPTATKAGKQVTKKPAAKKKTTRRK